MRSVWGTFPQYHTSADNLDFIRPEALMESLETCACILRVLERNAVYLNQNPYCEPQLGRRNLYPSVGGTAVAADTHALLWLLNLSDGRNSLIDIAERSGMPFDAIADAAAALSGSGLLSPAPESHESGRTSLLANTPAR